MLTTMHKRLSCRIPLNDRKIVEEIVIEPICAYERILHYTLEHDRRSVYCHSLSGQHQTKDALQ
jgi:hypothetical protein